MTRWWYFTPSTGPDGAISQARAAMAQHFADIERAQRLARQIPDAIEAWAKQFKARNEQIAAALKGVSRG